jgi:hypothetical protein
MAQSARVEAAPRTLAYARGYFYQRMVVLSALFSVALLLLVLGTPAWGPWLAIAGAAVAAYIVIVGLSPMLTNHTLTRSRIILRQGWYFRCVIPFSDAEAIGPYDGDPRFGLRLSPTRGLLYVVGGRDNLVAVRLKQPRRFAQVLFMTAREIVFDVDDREAFLAAVVERKAAGPPLPARKVPALPPVRR